ncbi:GPI mannosyltransferase 2-like [Zingiber officinale]|uniref:GPI mannosyltransferase 2-like n=1 Tax=Zingiber officinale TaxID=94328 RepID=UPI001C4B7ECC|nr:GPI mannosyltransferase 2-like [Zingiber officinale]
MPMAKKNAERAAECFLIRVALLSRLSLLTLIAFWRLLFASYDTSASLNPSCLSTAARDQPPEAVLWPRLGAVIEASVVWDGVFFLRIAQCGYEYEQAYAFLPLLPACIVLLSRSVFAPLVPIIGYRAVLAISGYLLNNLAFLLAAVFFYRVSVIVLKDTASALRASVLFCFNPASIFYSSIYSESLYALFSLGGIYYVFSGANTVAILLFALSGSARSNGALNAGYFCFQALRHAYDAINHKKKLLAAQAILIGAIQSILVFVPFLAFQEYGYFTICLGGNSTDSRPWCNERVPLLYGFLQSHYWGVGFLRYFQVKQLPNFLLASPTLSLAIGSVILYSNLLYEAFQPLHMHKKNDFTLVSKSVESNKSSDAPHASANDMSYNNGQAKKKIKRRKQQEIKQKISVCSEDHKSPDQIPQSKEEIDLILVLPFILHLAFLTFTAFFVMHVQVSTRFLSASPPIYWFASHLLVSNRVNSRRVGCLICAYFVSYVLLGSLLFSNFYPFT